MRSLTTVTLRCAALVTCVAVPVPATAQLPLFHDTATLPGPDGSRVGSYVALDGTTALIASDEKAWIAERADVGWSDRLVELTVAHVDAVALSGDTAVVVGLDDVQSVATAYVFERNLGGSGAWGLLTRLTHPPTVARVFGVRVALDADTLVIGESQVIKDGPDDEDIWGGMWGEVYVHQRDYGGPSGWGLVKALPHEPNGVRRTPPAFFGRDVAISGDTIVVAGMTGPHLRSCEQFFEFKWCLSTFVQVFERNRGGTDNWGLAGSLPVTLPPAGWFDPPRIVLDGDTVAVARTVHTSVDPRTHTYGQVFRREPDGSSWTQVGALVHPGPGHLALDGDRLGVSGLVATPAGWTGRVFVYARNQGGPDRWGVVQDLTGAGDPVRFGDGLTISGPSVLVGDPSYPLADTSSAPVPVPQGRVVEMVADLDRDSTPDNVDPCPEDPLDNIAGGCRRSVAAHPVVSDAVALLDVGTSRADGFLRLTATFENTGREAIIAPFFSVAALSGGNLLQNGDGGADGIGSTLTADVGDGVWAPNEILRITFVIALASDLPFQFFVNAQGDRISP